MMADALIAVPSPWQPLFLSGLFAGLSVNRLGDHRHSRGGAADGSARTAERSGLRAKTVCERRAYFLSHRGRISYFGAIALPDWMK
jgi:hypothetical protein